MENSSEGKIRNVRPFGSRVFVVDIPPEDQVSMGYQKAGLVPVVSKANVPAPTSGIIVALGTDPLMHSNMTVGDTVIFSRHSGSIVCLPGTVELRNLEAHEIITVISGHEDRWNELFLVTMGRTVRKEEGEEGTAEPSLPFPPTVVN